MNKSELRKKYIEIRKNVIDKELKSMIIFNTIIKEKKYIDSNTVALYRNIGSEVSTKKLIDYSLDKGKKVVLPKCIGEKMEFYIISTNEKYLISNFNIEEPLSNNIIDRNSIDLAIVPGICFDNNKNRIGFGKGYYDKYFGDLDTFKIGICYSEQVTDKIPIDEYDIKMNLVITDRYKIK